MNDSGNAASGISSGGNGRRRLLLALLLVAGAAALLVNLLLSKAAPGPREIPPVLQPVAERDAERGAESRTPVADWAIEGVESAPEPSASAGGAAAVGVPGFLRGGTEPSAYTPVSRESLAERIPALLAAPNLRKCVVALAVFSVSDGGMVYERSADRPLIVASNAKLFTSGAALALLGPDYRFETRLYADGEIEEGGHLHGDLIVVGAGDPDVTGDGRANQDQLLPRLVEAVRNSGLRRIAGRLVIDDHVFDRQYVPSTWRRTELTSPYNAPASGFSLFENCVSILVRPGEVVGDPARAALVGQPGVFKIVCKAKTVTGTNVQISAAGPRADEPLDPGPVTVRGNMPMGVNLYRLVTPVREPPLVAGMLLRQALVSAGIVVEGDVVLAEQSTQERLAGRSPLATVSSSLQDAMMKMNKESSNVVAEHVYKLCGWAETGQGSYASGSKAVLSVLGRLGIETMGASSADGSGISRQNRYTARQVAQFLAALYRSSLRDHFVHTLPESGVDGTLKNRLQEPEIKGRVRAKTGYVSAVSSLSGYCQTRQGEILSFSMLFNGYSGRNQYVKPIQDSIARLLIDLEAPSREPEGSGRND
ncbi:MAG: D-alanyl-D-alanine carboxypeptidase/D-alanyl-D-alanine-endopeptidase [Planctomycetota bacterium]